MDIKIMKYKNQYFIITLLFIIGLTSYIAFINSPQQLKANIFWGNKGKATYENSGIKKEVELRVWQITIPKGILASDGEYTNRVRITWNNVSTSVYKADRYFLYRSASPSGLYTKIGDTTLTLFDDTTALAGTIYYYKIKAYNTIAGYTKYSSYDSGYIDAPPPYITIISGPSNDFTTNKAFTITLSVNKDYGYWSTNNSPFYQFSNTTNLNIIKTTILKYYGNDGLNTSATQIINYTIDYILYVSLSGNDTNTGTSPSAPLKTIQIAADKAKNLIANRIYVESGIYTRGNGLNNSSDGIIITDISNLNLIGGWNNTFGSIIGYSELDGGGISPFRMIYISNMNNLNLHNFIVQNGNCDGNGGGIVFLDLYNSIISNSIISNNKAISNGGGIYIYNGAYNKFNISLNNNISSNYGGGIYIHSFSNTINGNVYYNTTYGSGDSAGGGGVCIDNNDFNTINCSIYNNNNDKSYGAGILIKYGANNIINGDVYNNNGGDKCKGGGIFIDNGSYNIINGDVYYNRTIFGGGGIYIKSSDNNIINGNIYNNTNVMKDHGGGIYIEGYYNTINGKIYNNSGRWGGGGIYIDGYYNNLYGDVYNNRSTEDNGGGVYIEGNDNIINCSIYSNTANASGGGIYLTGNNNRLTGLINNNYAISNGGGIALLNASDCIISNSIISNNIAAEYGGGIYMYMGTKNTIYADCNNNISSNNGGGVYYINSISNIINGYIHDNKSLIYSGGSLWDHGGGGICINSGYYNIINSSVYDNYVKMGCGGGIRIKFSDNNIINGAVYDNSSRCGGGIYLKAGYNTINGNVYNNTCNKAGGGGVYIDGSYNVLNCSIYSNNGDRWGGGVYIERNYNSLNANIYANEAIFGGGIYLSDGANNNLSGTLYNNNAVSGGGIYSINDKNSTLSINAYSNTAASGAGIYFSSSSNTLLVDSQLIDNRGVSTICLNEQVIGLAISNCILGGTNNLCTYVIKERINDILGHTIVSNVFMIDTNGYLYGDFNDGNIPPSEISILNTPGHIKHDANISAGNSIITSSIPLISEIVYVSSNGSDTNNGITASTPLKTIQLAINKAVEIGAYNIYIEKGTYTSGNGLMNTNGIIITNSELSFIGGWESGFGARLGGYSKLDGGDVAYNRVVLLSSVADIMIDGFIICGGYAAPNDYGGGMMMDDVYYSTITNCIISNNKAYSSGGGMYYDGSYNTIHANICENSSDIAGGVYASGYNNTFIGNVYNNNADSRGGGFWLSGGNTIIASIYSNTAIDTGGGVYGSGGEHTLEVDVYGNTATNGGGIYNSSMNLKIIGNIYNNIAFDSGGGLCGIFEFINANIHGNIASNYGGGIYISRGNITNSYITNNYSANIDSSIYIPNYSMENSSLCIKNCIIGGLNGSSAYAIYEAGSQDTIGHTIINNLFLTNRLDYLYHDYGGVDISISNWTNINHTNYTGASIAENNKVTNK